MSNIQPPSVTQSDAGALLRPPTPTRQTFHLPAPHIDEKNALMQALTMRHSAREFSDWAVPAHILSTLLWAACGVNRPATGGRTAPSAHDWREIDVYIANADGLYVYDATRHSLTRLLTKDIRVRTGLQSFASTAPVNLIYVADFSRMHDVSDEDRVFYSAADAGFISQNVYLFCALHGLATVVRGLVPRAALAKVMRLRPGQRIILAQSIGYPAHLH